MNEHVREVGVHGLQLQVRDQLLELRLRSVDPTRAEIDRRLAAEVVGPRPTADPIPRLEYHYPKPRVRQASCAGQARRTGSDDGHGRLAVLGMRRVPTPADCDCEEYHENEFRGRDVHRVPLLQDHLTRQASKTQLLPRASAPG